MLELVDVIQPSEQTHLLVTDAAGQASINATAGSNWGAIAAHYEYDAYGTALVRSGPLARSNAFRFSTKYYDEETGRGLAIPQSTPPPLVQEGLYYYGYRYYSPGMGRWVSRDPIGEHDSPALYRFCANAPPYLIDPQGRWTINPLNPLHERLSYAAMFRMSCRRKLCAVYAEHLEQGLRDGTQYPDILPSALNVEHSHAAAYWTLG